MGNVSGNSSKNKSSAKSELSTLAQAQEDIVRSNYKIFQDYFMPEFKELYNSFSPDSAAGSAQFGLTAGEINNSFDAAQKQTEQALARQNLGGTGAGLALVAANNRARSSALANAYANQMAKSNTDKANALGSVLGQFLPKPTTAAPTVSESASKGGGSGWGVGF